MNWTVLKLLGWLQRQCAHDPRFVSADILEGSGGSLGVGWCRRCGAYRVHSDISLREGEWHEPRADWWVEKE